MKKIDVQSYEHLKQILDEAEQKDLRGVFVWNAGKNAFKDPPSYVELRKPDPKSDPPKHIIEIHRKLLLKQRLSEDERRELRKHNASRRPC